MPQPKRSCAWSASSGESERLIEGCARYMIRSEHCLFQRNVHLSKLSRGDGFVIGICNGVQPLKRQRPGTSITPLSWEVCITTGRTPLELQLQPKNAMDQLFQWEVEDARALIENAGGDPDALEVVRLVEPGAFDGSESTRYTVEVRYAYRQVRYLGGAGLYWVEDFELDLARGVYGAEPV